MNLAGILRAWGRDPSRAQLDCLVRFSAWLVDEAIPAGGLGPGEIERVEERHVLDSLAFLNGLPDPNPASLVDLGSGVGLPGIPLAIMLPQTRVTLLDRSGRRVRLARRAVRVLGLTNVAVVEEPIASREAQVVTMRAVMEPSTAVALIETEFPGATALIALARTPQRPDPVPAKTGHTTTVIDGGRGMLDPAPWLLIMAPS